MALWFQISSGTNEPIYNQIVEQIENAIAKGRLNVGDKLPAVRKLAAELVINPNTVARAYTILEQRGLVATKTGSGTFISSPSAKDVNVADMNILADRIDSVISRGLNLGIKPAEFNSMFKNRLEKFVDQKSEEQKNG